MVTDVVDTDNTEFDYTTEERDRRP